MIALFLACSSTTSRSEVDTSPAPFGYAECEVCGMTVSAQPAPRGQLIYRDGTHPYFCSLGELRAALQARSPHGEPLAIYVETLPRDVDPDTLDTAPLPWVRAEQAWYVFGASRPQIMGLPGLSFASEADARAAAERLGLQAVPWSTVLDIPFDRVPSDHLP